MCISSSKFKLNIVIIIFTYIIHVVSIYFYTYIIFILFTHVYYFIQYYINTVSVRNN